MHKKLAQKLLQTPLFNNPLYKWVYMKHTHSLIPKLLGRPRRVIVENTNHCNLQCSFCPNPVMKRKKGVMSYELFCRIVDECVVLGIEHLYHFGIGEPLIDRDYEKKNRYAKERGIEDLHTVTNGVLLDRIPTCDYLGITINDESVIPNVKKMWEQRKGNIPEIECRLKEDTAHLAPLLKPYCDKVDVYLNITSWGDVIKGNVPHGIKFPCSDLWSSMFVTWEGKVALCCKDYECKFELGDLNKDSIADVWKGSRLADIRDRHLKYPYDPSICKGCESNTHLVNPYWRVEL